MLRRAFLAALAAPAVAAVSNLGHAEPVLHAGDVLPVRWFGVDYASGPDEVGVHIYGPFDFSAEDMEKMYRECSMGSNEPSVIWIESTAKGVRDAAL